MSGDAAVDDDYTWKRADSNGGIRGCHTVQGEFQRSPHNMVFCWTMCWNLRSPTMSVQIRAGCKTLSGYFYWVEIGFAFTLPCFFVTFDDEFVGVTGVRACNRRPVTILGSFLSNGLIDNSTGRLLWLSIIVESMQIFHVRRHD